jgi:hypothetical protein
MDYTEFKEEINHDLNTTTMEKVYQINMYSPSFYNDELDCRTLGIFTNKDIAKGIVMKFERDLEDKLSELYAEEDLYDGNKKYVYNNGVFLHMNSDFLTIEGEIRELQKTSYDIQEIIINQLFR